MSIVSALFTILGLAVFEIVSSIDNAVINAEILDTMSARGRKWFLLWGFLFAVFVVRGLLPWIIVWAANPALGFFGAFSATFSSSPAVAASIAHSAPVLLSGGGIFLVLLFLHWLFAEEKNIGLPHERFFARHAAWFYAVAFVVCAALIGRSFFYNASLVYGIAIGALLFFVMQGFKVRAEKAEEDLKGGTSRSDFSKILYLEIIDASFSIDGILGAFAFTFSVPFILIGNGIGAFVLRKLTVGNIERIKRYKFLKNGAMYAIFCLAVIMLFDAFGHSLPEWLSPLVMLVIVGYFFLKSKQKIGV